MARKPPQYFLADLVAIVALCGLFLGLVRTSDPRGNVPVLTFLMIGVVVTAWTTFRALQAAPRCDECGRRFIAPEKMEPSPPVCAQCGQPQLQSRRLRNALAIGFWAVLGLIVLNVLIMIGFPPDSLWLFTGPQKAVFASIVFGGMMLLFGLLFVLIIARSLNGFAQLKPRPCENCGAIILRGGATEALMCPRCRLRHQPRKEPRKEIAKGVLIILALLSLVGIFGWLMLGNFVSSLLGISHWIVLPLLIVATIIVSLVVFMAVIFAVFILRRRRLQREPFVLGLARQFAGEEGNVVRSGSTTVWYSGPTNPVPVLLQQMEFARSHLESLAGREIGHPPFIRILCFQKRAGFDAFVRPLTNAFSHYMKIVDHLYVPQPFRILIICDEELPYLVSDKDNSAAMAFCQFFMELLPGKPHASWVQQGILKRPTTDDDLVRLNRKILASLSRRTTLGAHLFDINNREILEQLKDWSDHSNFRKVDQFQAELRSVFEYLAGKQAPEERREHLRAFLADDKAKAQPAKVFENHFGHGFDRLVESWQEWVREQGVGTFTRPPSCIEEGLLNRLIPLLENRQANPDDRTLAIREMGSNGYALGADALIGLLGNDDAIASEEVTWALEAISGMAYGDDPDGWTAWFSTLPSEARERRRQPEKVPVMNL
jgi:hypothetical protein